MMSVVQEPFSLARWLGDTPLDVFLRDTYLREPFSLARAASEYTSLCSWEVLGRVLAHEIAPDVMVVQDGRLVETPAPRSEGEARALHARGCSIVVRFAERQEPALKVLADGFARDLEGRVAVQLYVTPAGRHSFGWHYDVEDVFVLQTEGVKDYHLRRNTVNPNPVLETMPRDMRFEREITPRMSCTLAPGDWLYIPSGFWHRADAQTDAMSISIGVFQPTTGDVLERLRRFLLRSPVWRRRLLPRAAFAPGAGMSPEEADARRFADLEVLGQDVARLLGDPSFVAALLDESGGLPGAGRRSRS